MLHGKERRGAGNSTYCDDNGLRAVGQITRYHKIDLQHAQGNTANSYLDRKVRFRCCARLGGLLQLSLTTVCADRLTAAFLLRDPLAP